jgi:hypothetical protein
MIEEVLEIEETRRAIYPGIFSDIHNLTRVKPFNDRQHA